MADLGPDHPRRRTLHLRLSSAVRTPSQRLGRAPTTAELDVDPADAVEAIVAGNACHTQSLDVPAYYPDRPVFPARHGRLKGRAACVGHLPAR